MASRDIGINVRVLGAAQAARQLASVTSELHRMGQQSRRSSDLVRNMGQSFSAMGNQMAQVARRSSYVIGAMGTAAVYAGIKFNATMESQKVAFESFLGSKKAADSYVKSLVQIATKTPFKLMDVIQGTRHLLAFGMQADEARGTMNLLGNAIATSAGGAEEIERSTRALGQIQAAGVLHAQDLNQLIQANVLTLPQLTARMGTTTKKFRKDMSLGKVTAQEFFAALRESWAKDPMYKGAAEKQMRTFNGQVERMKDMFDRAMGAMTHGLFEVLRKKIIPAAGDLLGVMEAIWNPEQPRTFGERAKETWLQIKATWEPLKKSLQEWWKDKDMTAKLKATLEKFVAWAVPAVTQLGEDAARGMWEAWKGFDPKTKAITAVALLTRLGITKTVMGGAAGMLWAYLKGGAVPGGKGKGTGGIGGGVGGASVMNVTAGVVNVYQGAAPKGGKPGKKGPGGPVVAPTGGGGGFLGRALKLGGLTAVAMGAVEALGGGSTTDVFKAADPTRIGELFGLPSLSSAGAQYSGKKGWGELWRDTEDRAGAVGGAIGGAVGDWKREKWRGGYNRDGKWYPSKEAAMAAPEPQVLRNTPPEFVVNVQVDGKTIASAVHRAGVHKQAAR